MDKLIFSKAIEALGKGEVIVYPTDTLYGLGADIFNKIAINKIYEIKKRPINLPLSVAVANFQDIENIAYVDDKIRLLSDTFLPGKLTMILKKKDCISELLTGGFENVAIRIPDNNIALSLISEFGPITATSANIHGTKTPDIISEIRIQFKNKDISVYLNAGKITGKPSTIVDLTGKDIQLVREGAIPKKDILDAIKNE